MRVTTITCDHCGEKEPNDERAWSPKIQGVAVVIHPGQAFTKSWDLCESCAEKLGPYIDAFFVPPPKTRRADPGITT